MRLIVDRDAGTLLIEAEDGAREIPLFSPEAFAELSQLWLQIGWANRYSYSFSWLGRPVIQLPEDLVRVQEAIFRVRPDVLVETGIAHGGSLVFYASVLKAIGKGRVVGIDVEIKPENRAAIESHPLASYITMIEGDSTSSDVLRAVRELIQPEERVMVVLDSHHAREHVARELDAYHGLVSPNSYIVVTDGVMRDLADTPGGDSAWSTDNPAAAATEFVRDNDGFVLDPPPRLFDESTVSSTPTYWPNAWIRRREQS